MKTITIVSLFLCLLVTTISADKTHKHQAKLVKSGHQEQHKRHATELEPVNKADEKNVELHSSTNEQTEAKPAAAGRKHRNNHHGKNKKAGSSNPEAHNGRSRKAQQTKLNKHNGQRSHQNNKQHSRKHGRGKQAQ